MSPSVTSFHQWIQSNLVDALSPFVRSKKLGRIFVAPLDVFLTEDDVFQPDILFIRQDRLSEIDLNDRIHFAPDLVVEILSPSTAEYDYTRKKAIYCEGGVKEYWIVDPADETVEIMLKDGNYYRTEAILQAPALLESTMFPGFSMKIENVFAI
jgi:Uma2 family endonuclease